MTYGRERRGVIQKRFGELFLDRNEGNRGKNAEQGFAAVIVFVPRERVDFFDTLSQKGSLKGCLFDCLSFGAVTDFPVMFFHWPHREAHRF